MEIKYYRLVLLEGWFMVIRKWRTCFFLVVFLPTLITLIDANAMFILMSLLILTVCGRSLCNLVVANFASEEYALHYSEQNTFVPSCAKDAKVTQAAVFGINILIILYCIKSIQCQPPVFAIIMAAVVALGWIFDLGRTLIHFVCPPDLDADWTIRDSLLEVFLWVHNILSIALVLVMFVVRYL